MNQELNFNEIIDQIKKSFKVEKSAGVDITAQVNLTGPQGGPWNVTIRNQQLTIEPGVIANPKITVSADMQDCMDIYNGKMDAMKAFMSGKIHLTGDMGQAVKLSTLFM